MGINTIEFNISRFLVEKNNTYEEIAEANHDNKKV
jgi:hypothetical protein